ncbi:MAG: glycosyltransferase family 2 protein [Bacillota bacterium]
MKKPAAYMKDPVSIIIPVFNKVEYTNECIASLMSTIPADTEVIIVDNGSTDGTGQYLSTLPPNFRVITNDVNMGYSKACNQGASLARGRYLVFLNNDTIALPNWLEEMVKTALDASIGVVGSRLLYPNGTLQHAGVILVESKQEPLMALHSFYNMPGDLPEANVPRDYQVVTGACLLIKREVFYEVGGFNEEYINSYEDVDLCLKARQAGHRVVYCPTSVLYHHESVSEGRHRHDRRNADLFIKKWRNIIPDYLFYKGKLVEWRKPVSVMLATHNSIGTIKNCMNALLASTTSLDQIIIIDNNSNDGTREYLKGLKRKKPSLRILLNKENHGISRAYQMALPYCTNEYVALLIPDAQVAKKWLLALTHFETNDIGAVGPLTNKKTEKQWFQHYINTLECPGVLSVEQIESILLDKNSGRVMETNLLNSLCILMPKKVIADLGLFDKEEMLEKCDPELSRKLEKEGYKLLVAPDTFVFCQETAESHVQRSYNLNSGMKKEYAHGQCPTHEKVWGFRHR